MTSSKDPTTKKAPPDRSSGAFCREPGSDLLWHARGAHYHRRRAFSLPSSEWDRVVPARYGRQANCSRFMQPDLAVRLQAPPIRLVSVSTLVAFTMESLHRHRSSRGPNHLRLYGQASRAISTG